MQFENLRYFVEVAKTGSFSKASKHLYITQPALSIAIQKLEDELQTKLFIRSRKGATLTPSGDTLLDYARQIFQLVEAARTSVMSVDTGMVGEFKVGCPDVICVYFLSHFLHVFFQDYPSIDVVLKNGSSPVVFEQVLSRDAHFGIVVNAPHNDKVTTVELFEDSTNFYCSRRLKEEVGLTADSSKEELHQFLASQPLFYVQHLPQSEELLQYYTEHHIPVPKMIGCHSYEIVRAFIEKGMGVGLVPMRVSPTLKSMELELLHPLLPFVSDKIYLIFRNDFYFTRAAQTFVDELRCFPEASGFADSSESA